MPLALFAAHLDYLQRRCRVILLAEYLAARREGRRLPDRSVVLTFDDGTRNFLTVVAPLLVQRGLSATALLITHSARGARSAACQPAPSFSPSTTARATSSRSSRRFWSSADFRPRPSSSRSAPRSAKAFAPARSGRWLTTTCASPGPRFARSPRCPASRSARTATRTWT